MKEEPGTRITRIAADFFVLAWLDEQDNSDSSSDPMEKGQCDDEIIKNAAYRCFFGRMFHSANHPFTNVTG